MNNKLDIDNILDFMISFNSNKTKKMWDFLNKEQILKEMSDQQQYFWNIKEINKKQYEVPPYIIQEQKRLSDMIDKNKTLSVIAPTSFGKTFVIINKIINYPYIRIIISPTLSLCNEYFIRLNKNVKSISMSPFVKADVYILTPEKFLTAKKNNIFKDQKISFVVFDEFYEAFTGDRYSIFAESYYFLKKKSLKLIQIIPHNKVKLPQDFQTDETFITSFTATNRRIIKYIRITSKDKKYYRKYICSEFNKYKTDGFEVTNKLHDKEKIIEESIQKVLKNDKNLIILESKKNMYKRLPKIASLIQNVSKNTILKEIKKYLDETAEHTQLAKYILKGIAYHNGTMDKFLRFLIESAFNAGEIKVLFGNSALTKGVNLSPDILMILKYPSMINEFNKEIQDIEILNAFGRTGRTKQNKIIGTIIIIAKKNSVAEKKDYLIKGPKTEIIISKPELPEIKEVKSFKDAYRKFIVSNKKIIISKQNKDLLLNYLNPSNYKEVTNKDIFDCIKSVYGIEFHNEWEKNRRFLIKSYVMKTGYSSLIKNNRSYAREVKYLTAREFSPTNKEFWIDKKTDKKIFNILYEPNTFHEDLIAQYSYEQYENVAGFYFAQLLSKAIEAMEKTFDETKVIIKNYNERKTEDENIASSNGWPDSFVDYYLMKNKTSQAKDYLNNLIEEIYQI